MAGRSCFRPKFPEMPKQCSSCPFRKGNEKEWAEIIGKLHAFAKKHGLVLPLSSQTPHRARAMILEEVSQRGEFLCHSSVYDKNMKMRASSENRQCPGATHWFKEGKPL